MKFFSLKSILDLLCRHLIHLHFLNVNGWPKMEASKRSTSAQPALRRNLMIVGIFDGIIKKFNEKFPRQAVKKFDKISAVNGKAGTSNEMRRTTGATLH